MAKPQQIYGRLLSEFARAVEHLTDEQLHKLLTGEARLSLSVRSVKARVERKHILNMVEFRDDFSDIKRKFCEAKSREECAVMVEYAFPEKAEMFAFARYLHLPVQPKEGQKSIRDQIVGATAGARIRSEIIRGGHSIN